jgi:hypothetical protein
MRWSEQSDVKGAPSDPNASKRAASLPTSYGSGCSRPGGSLETANGRRTGPGRTGLAKVWSRRSPRLRPATAAAAPVVSCGGQQ